MTLKFNSVVEVVKVRVRPKLQPGA